MKKIFLYTLYLSLAVSFLGCTPFHNLKRGDSVGAEKGVVFSRYILRFRGGVRKYYKVVDFFYYKALDSRIRSRFDAWVRARRTRQLEAWKMLPGVYKAGKTVAGRYHGMMYHGGKKFTVKANTLNYAGTLVYTLDTNQGTVNVSFVVGRKAYEKAKKMFRRRFPALAAKYPFRPGFKLVKIDDGEGSTEPDRKDEAEEGK